MADEKRRLIYELIVTAVGADKAKKTTDGIGESLLNLRGIAARAAGPLAALFTFKNFADAIDDMTRYNAQLEALGVSGKEAATAINGVQSAALATGQSMESVGKAMLEAINLSQILGRSTDYATETTEAFVAIAASEGRTAQDAAQQIQTLAFALDSGVLSGKEFIGMLKSSNTFQKAAQDALGMTTQQLVAMAKQGDITAVQLVKIIEQMEKIGQQRQASQTVTTFTEDLKTMFRVAAQGFAQGARGVNTPQQQQDPTQTLNPDAVRTSEAIADHVRASYQMVGAQGRLIKNSVDVLADGARLTYNILTGDIEQLETARSVTQGYTRDLKELTDAWNDLDTAVTHTFTNAEQANKESQAKAKREAANLAAENAAWGKTFSAAFGKSFDDAVEKWRKSQEHAKQERERIAREEEAEAKRRKAERAREQLSFKEDVNRSYYKSLEDQGKETEKLGAKLFGEDDLAKTLESLQDIHIPGLRESYLDSFAQMEDVTMELQSALGNLFTGGIANAREFFAQLATGIANIFAQLAAAQAAEGIGDFFRSLFPKYGSFTSPGAATQAGSGLLSDAWRNAAKGRAFAHGYEIPMGTGGVVSQPTVMPLAAGQGLMGEAGPEAVMPLRRTSGGRLGVQGAMPSITIVNRLGVPATARMEKSNDRMTLVMEAAQLGASLAESRIGRSLRSGYGETARSIQSTYGLRRRQ